MAKYTFAQFTATRLYISTVSYSPDGKLIAHIHNGSGQFNLWLMPSGGGMPRQMTSFTDNTVRTFAWSPHGQQIVIQADHSGDEQHRLYMLKASGSWPEPITRSVKAQHNISSQSWAPDGKRLAYSSNEANPANMDVIIRDFPSGEETRP